MRIRDALESDVDALAGLTGRPHDVVLDSIHDRSVRVAVDGENGADGADGEHGEDPQDGDVIGFIAFDARSRTVHVTDFGGETRATSRLFEEPRRFAAEEGLDLEVVVPDGDEQRIETVEDAGFVSVGEGPRFDGQRTILFRSTIDDESD